MGVETYTINLINRLTGVTYPDGSSTAYSYDPAGNRLTETTGTSTVPYVYDDASRLSSVDGAAYSYDGAGNRLPHGSTTYGWDWSSRLNTADNVLVVPNPPLASELLEELTSRAFNDVDAYVLETGRATGLPVVTPNAGIINQILSGPLVRRERFVNIQVVVPPPWP